MEVKDQPIVLTMNGANEEWDPEKVVGERRPLSPVSTILHRPNFYWTIIVMLGSKTKIDVDRVKTGLETTIIRHPRFSSILVEEKPGSKKKIWQRVHVITDDHVIIPDLTPTGLAATNNTLVEDYISSLSTATFSLTKPLWEVHILNIPTSEAEATFVFRVHHSIGDGLSLMSLLLACSHKASAPAELPSLPRSSREKKNAATFLEMVVGLWRTFVDVLFFFLIVLFVKDNAVPLPPKDQVNLPPKRVAHRTLNLDDIKLIKDVVGCTVNDVLVGLTSAGLSRYLSRRYAEKNIPLSNNIRFQAICAVNIRPSAGIHALAEMMEGRGGAPWGNRIGFSVLQFPIAIFEDPFDYIRHGVKIAQRKFKNNFAPLISNFCVDLVVKFGAKKVMSDLCHRAFRHTSMTFSNVVGPVEDITFYGHPLVYIAPTVYGTPQAIGIHYTSYVNIVKVSIGVDQQIISDPHELLDDLEEMLKEIKNAATKKSLQSV